MRYIETELGEAILIHFGTAQNHILARAERNPHTTVSGDEQAQLFT